MGFYRQKIGDYWVIPPKRVRNQQKTIAEHPSTNNNSSSKEEYFTGDKFIHKTFDTGIVISKNETFIEVDFSGVGVKKISRSCIKKS